MSHAQVAQTLAPNPAENYERYFVPAIAAPLAHELVDAAAIRPGMRVLDVACGTGIVARLAAERAGPSGSVTGLDVHPGMIAVARSVSDSALGIDWRVASADAMPFADGSFDIVMCQMGLQFVPNPLAALREMRRVLVPGGRLVFNLPGPTPPMMAALGDALARHAGSDAGHFVEHVFWMSDAVAVGEMLAAAGFHDGSVEASQVRLPLPDAEDFLWQYVHSTPLADVAASMDDDRLEAIGRDVKADWRRFVDDGRLVLDLRMLTANVQA